MTKGAEPKRKTRRIIDTNVKRIEAVDHVDASAVHDSTEAVKPSKGKAKKGTRSKVKSKAKCDPGKLRRMKSKRVLKAHKNSPPKTGQIFSLNLEGSKSLTVSVLIFVIQSVIPAGVPGIAPETNKEKGNSQNERGGVLWIKRKASGGNRLKGT